MDHKILTLCKHSCTSIFHRNFLSFHQYFFFFFEVHHFHPQCPLALDDREAKGDCLRVNSEFIHSQWQIWRYPNLSEQSLHHGNLELCATSIDLCASRHPKMSARPKLAKNFFFFSFLLVIQPK